MGLPIGMVQNGIKMAIHKSKEQKQADVTPGYVNRKLESMMAALFDTIEDFERRVKGLEKQVFRLTQEIENGKVEE